MHVHFFQLLQDVTDLMHMLQTVKKADIQCFNYNRFS